MLASGRLSDGPNEETKTDSRVKLNTRPTSPSVGGMAAPAASGDRSGAFYGPTPYAEALADHPQREPENSVFVARPHPPHKLELLIESFKKGARDPRMTYPVHDDGWNPDVKAPLSWLYNDYGKRKHRVGREQLVIEAHGEVADPPPFNHCLNANEGHAFYLKQVLPAILKARPLSRDTVLRAHDHGYEPRPWVVVNRAGEPVWDASERFPRRVLLEELEGGAVADPPAMWDRPEHPFARAYAAARASVAREGDGVRRRVQGARAAVMEAEGGDPRAGVGTRRGRSAHRGATWAAVYLVALLVCVSHATVANGLPVQEPWYYSEAGQDGLRAANNVAVVPIQLLADPDPAQCAAIVCGVGAAIEEEPEEQEEPVLLKATKADLVAHPVEAEPGDTRKAALEVWPKRIYEEITPAVPDEATSPMALEPGAAGATPDFIEVSAGVTTTAIPFPHSWWKWRAVADIVRRLLSRGCRRLHHCRV